jgi:SRSO17 transposase
LSLDGIAGLPERLREFHERFRRHMRTKTRDTSEYGFHYISGLIRMEAERNMANIGRKTDVAEQNMQQFISDSPWSGRDLIGALQTDIGFREEFSEESVFLIDESAEEKAGSHSAGAERQYNGRLGKVEMSQVGVFLGLVNNGYHTWYDGELYFPKQWFGEAYTEKRKRAGVPDDLTFKTKLELALAMLKRAKDKGIPTEIVDCDSLYGRSGWLRDEFAELEMEYYADIPEDTTVYIEPPLLTWPLTKRGKRASKPEVSGLAYKVKALKSHSQTEWHTLTLRPTERGILATDFARWRVWTVRTDGSVRKEWLLIRRDKKKATYSLSNASPRTSLFTMAQRKSQRYFIERSNQDAKSELGWDEFQAIKYNAWEHHLALTIMASWFITQTRLDWAQEHEQDPQLLESLELDVLPALSMANVRELLRAAMPLPQLTPLQAAQLVAKHLDNRARSRKSRLRKALGP